MLLKSGVVLRGPLVEKIAVCHHLLTRRLAAKQQFSYSPLLQSKNLEVDRSAGVVLTVEWKATDDISNAAHVLDKLAHITCRVKKVVAKLLLHEPGPAEVLSKVVDRTGHVVPIVCTPTLDFIGCLSRMEDSLLVTSLVGSVFNREIDMPYDAHDTAVMVRVNRFILAANKAFPSLTVAEKLEQAWSQNIKEREQDSTNAIGRDADYYFAARKELASSGNVASKIGKAVGGNVAWVIYGGLKICSEALGHPEWMRTDKDKPNAPVGGLTWMNRGSADGLREVGDRVGDLMPHVPQEQQPPQKRSHEPRPSGIRRGSM